MFEQIMLIKTDVKTIELKRDGRKTMFCNIDIDGIWGSTFHVGFSSKGISAMRNLNKKDDVADILELWRSLTKTKP